MEQFTKLPQVKISHLEHLISQRSKLKTPYHENIQPDRNSTALLGKKPFYTHNRKTAGLCCSHLKCSCKNNNRNSNQSRVKFQFLVSKSRGKKYEGDEIIRYKTQVNEKDNDIINKALRRSKPIISNIRELASMQIMSKTLSYKKLEGLYEKIQKELRKKLFMKFGKESEKEQFEVFVKDYLEENYKNKEPLQNLHKLFEKIQMCLSKNLPIKQRKHPKRKTLAKTCEAPKIQSIINPPKKPTKKKKKTKNKKKHKSDQELSEEIESAKTMDDETIDFINLLLSGDKTGLLQAFLNQMVEINITKFDQNMKRIQDVVNQYSNQPKIRETIQQIMKILENHIQNSAIKPQVKKNKSEKVKKLFKNKLSSDICYLQVEPIHKPLPSRKTIKTKKSQRAFRPISDEYFEDGMSNNSNKSSSKFKSTVSLAQRIQDDQISSKSKQRSTVNILTNKTYRSSKIKTNKSYANNVNNVDDDICQSDNSSKLSSFPENKSLQELNEQQIQQYFKQKNKKKTIRRQTNSNESNRSSVPVQVPHKNRFQSVFKCQKQLEVRTIRDKYNKQSLDIKQFMYDNKETIVKGANNLKDYNLSKLIIGQNDSILTKKKKLRIIKQKINQNEILNNRSLFDQLLAYIHLYQLQCKLIMQKGVNDKNNIYDQYNQLENNQSSLIKASMFNDELKFIQLCKDYYYGEHEEDEELNFNSNKNRFQIEELIPKVVSKENIAQNHLKSPVDAQLQNDLIQKDLPYIGHTEKTKDVDSKTKIPRKSIRKMTKIKTEKQNDKNQKEISKIQSLKCRTRWISYNGVQQKSMYLKRLDRFLLTQNTICL